MRENKIAKTQSATDAQVVPSQAHIEKPWKPAKNHGNQPKPMKNHETILKNHGKQPKTMKNHETTLKNHGNQPKTMEQWKPTKMVGFSWFQVGYVTDAGPQLTSFDPKMLRDRRGAPTDLL